MSISDQPGEPADPTDPRDPHDDPFAGLTLDEDFIRGATVKEGSVRARSLSARRRRGWSWQGPLTAVIAAVLVAAALNPGVVQRWFTGKAGGASALPTPGVTTAQLPITATADHPFAGSPAASWADGAAGIVLPAARPVGRFDRAQVAADLAEVKTFLVDSGLDAKVLAGGYPTAAMDLIDPQETSPAPGVNLVDYYRRAFAHPTAKADPTDLFSRFDPHQAAVIGSVVKVRGTATLSGDGADGVKVATDYAFVYPVRPLGETAARASVGAVARTVVRRWVDFDFTDPARYRTTPGTFGVDNFWASVGNSDCTAPPGYFWPIFPGGDPSAPPTGPAVDPYDRSTPLAATGKYTCGYDIRT